MRFKDVNWNCGDGPRIDSIDHAHLAMLMDLRDELKELNRHVSYGGGLQRELRGLRRDIKKMKGGK